VPTAFARPSWSRKSIVTIAAWLVVVQAFLTGVATAQAGAMLADPLEAGAICHGTATSDGTSGPATSHPAATWHLCCSYCLAAAPALPPPSVQIGAAWLSFAAATSRFSDFAIVVAREAVRAGPSQAPPGQA
jgi:hypothetical protein